MNIKNLNEEEKLDAIKLVWRTFLEFEAPEYSDKGIKTFKEFIDDKNNISLLDMFGAFENDELVGVIATRSNKSHISLFFVDKKYHKQGIGKKLFNAMIADNPNEKITVNSSPYAVEVYHHLGFKDTNVEQLDDGIRYTPMQYDLAYIKV